jgi:Concanavalin A-like lectin/glucanases superfamily
MPVKRETQVRLRQWLVTLAGLLVLGSGIGTVDYQGVGNGSAFASPHASLNSTGIAAAASVTQCVTRPANMVAWYPLDEQSGSRMTDLMGKYSGTYYGVPTINSGQYVLNSRHFNGTSQYGEAPTGPNFGIGDFSIDAWIKVPITTTGAQVIVDKRTKAPLGYALYLRNGLLGIEVADGSTTPTNNGFTNYETTSKIPSDGAWHFVAATVQRNPFAVTLWIDASSKTLNSPVRAGNVNNDSPLRIGRLWPIINYTSEGFFNGSIDEVELFSRALTPAEISSIYNARTAGKCKPPAPTCVARPANMVAWYPLDEQSGSRMTDLTGTYSGTYYGVPTINSGQYVLNSRHFNGTSQYGQAPTGPNFGTGDFSIDAWIKVPITTTGLQVIVDKRTRAPLGYALYLRDGLLGIEVADGSTIPTNNGFTNYETTSKIPSDGAWHFVAGTVRRNPFAVTLWIDASSKILYSPVRTGNVNNNSPLRVGRLWPNYGYASEGFFNGSIDEVELFSRALTPAEISSIYNARTAGKCK